MKFDDSFFEGEVREGFYVSPLMKRAWAAQLEVLERIDHICERNNIEYFAHAGTLLGAIRHGGFIPWDDDIDIEMKRLDYERFLKIAEKELSHEYIIRSSKTDNDWVGCFSRLINTTELPLRAERRQEFHGFPFSAGVDIFPIDYLPVNKAEEKAMLDLYTAVYTLAFDWDKEEMTEEEKMSSLEIIGECCNYTFTQNQPYRQQLWNLAGNIGAMYWDTGGEAKELAPIYRIANSHDFRLPVSWYKSTKRVPFENTTIPVQDGCEQILALHFGQDYMVPKIAPCHEYPFYKKQIQVLIGGLEESKKKRNDTAKYSIGLSDYITDEKTGNVLPKEWAEKVYTDGRRKKILLYHTSADSVICQENFLKDKLRYVFGLSRGNEEILLWWLPGNFAQLGEGFVNEISPQLMPVYAEMKTEFINDNLGIYDDSGNINRAVAMADAYFGDEGKVLELFKKSGKPIMIQNYEIAE